MNCKGAKMVALQSKLLLAQEENERRMIRLLY